MKFLIYYSIKINNLIEYLKKFYIPKQRLL